MRINLLDKGFEVITLIENFKSIIWSDRYDDVGDFELEIPASIFNLDIFKRDLYFYYEKSEHTMILETIEIVSDAQDGNMLKLSGRSLESILDRRVLGAQTVLDNVSLEDGIKRILNENIINPSLADRKISNFIYEASGNSYIQGLKLTAQYEIGDNILDIITSLCQENKIGFKITVNSAKQFVFKLYKGVDRSYSQLINPYIVFSSALENLSNSDYLESSKEMKTVTLVGGEGEGSARKMIWANGEFDISEFSGLNRRELFTDASGLSTNSGSISTAEYNKQLTQKGSENLKEVKLIKTFQGEISANPIYIYGKDFYIGDIVQISNEFGSTDRVTVSEYISSEDESGYDEYPTFISVEE